MTSIYDFMLSNKGLDTEAFFEKLAEETGELFQPIHDKHELKPVSKEIVLYIIYAYSLESKLHLLKSNWATNKNYIAEYVGLPDWLYAKTVNLEDETIKQVITAYLHEQTDFEWRHLQMNRDIYEALLADMYTNMHDSEHKIQAKLVNETRQTLNKIREEILELQESIEKKYKVYTENTPELGLPKTIKNQSLNPASSEQIRRA